MFTLAFYDVTGIQKFVFESAKAAEIVGASAIVEKALKKWLVKAVTESCPGANVEWTCASSFRSLGSGPPPAEIVYVGGGNALVAFSGADQNESKGRAVVATRRLARTVFEETRGTLQIAVAYLPHDNKKYAADMLQLQQNLASAKAQLVPAWPLVGLGITAEGSTDGLPAEHIEKNDDLFLSGPAHAKREAAADARTYSDLMPGVLSDGYMFPIEFDDLWQKQGENHIAIVHIDGNSMGKVIKKVTDRSDDAYEVSVQRMRKLSSGIAAAYAEAFRETVERIPEGLENEEFCDLFGVRQDEGLHKTFLPVRPLVFNGDDVTLVCNGHLGIWLATEMLRNISRKSLTDLMPDGSPVQLSACAGVAIVKSHFPFARAYSLAEKLCESAKKAAKARDNDPDNTVCGSWIDFHIIYSGITRELRDLRTASYNVPGMPEATVTRSGCPAYNLLGRPWEVVSPDGRSGDNVQSWLAFTEAYDTLKKSWPRSRLKGMRDVMIRSEQETSEYLDECSSRGCMLPAMWSVGGKTVKAFTSEHRTPYFDALELLDFYVRPPTAEGAR